MRFARQISTLLFIIALPVALVTTNIRIVMNEPRVYEYAVDHFDTTVTTGIVRSELLRASGELRDFFNGGEPDPASIRVLDGGESIPLFSMKEAQHLRDVRDVFQMTFRVQEGAIIFIMAYVVMVFFWAREGSLRRLAREVLISAGASFVVLGVFGLFAVAGFDAAFERFHLIAFDNDLWQLDPRTDHLIQMFPEDFWFDVTLWVTIATAVELAVLSVVSGIVLLLTREPRMRTVKVTGQLQPQAEG